jgi:hypothetical protein
MQKRMRNEVPTLNNARIIIFPKDDALGMAQAKGERESTYKTTIRQSMSN